MSDDRGINRNAEDRDRGRRRHALGDSLLSLLRDERGSPRDTDLVLQGRIGKRGVLPVDCRRAPDGRGSDRRAERHGPWIWPVSRGLQHRNCVGSRLVSLGRHVRSQESDRRLAGETRSCIGQRLRRGASDRRYRLAAKKDWKHFCEYEEGLNEAVANQRLAVLCTYPLAACGAMEILDVVRTHQFAVAKRHRSWDVIETAGFKQAKAEIKRLNDELEQRVIERTSQLMLASDALREAQAELAHVNRVTTMGQLAASIAHELNQPLTAAVTNAHAALRWLGL